MTKENQLLEWKDTHAMALLMVDRSAKMIQSLSDDLVIGKTPKKKMSLDFEAKFLAKMLKTQSKGPRRLIPIRD